MIAGYQVNSVLSTSDSFSREKSKEIAQNIVMIFITNMICEKTKFDPKMLKSIKKLHI